MKIVLLTNILTPYRKAFYSEMERQSRKMDMDFRVLVTSETESNRMWDYDDFRLECAELLEKRVLFGRTDQLYISTNLKKRLNELQPDILVMAGSYTFLPVWQALHWAKRKKCAPFFWSESHLNEKRDYNKAIYCIRETIRHIFYTKFSKGGFWYPGEKAYQLIVKYAGPNVKYIQVPNLIDNRKFLKYLDSLTASKGNLREKYGLSQDKQIFFTSARLSAVKGLLPFIESLALLEESNQIQIAVAGNGELKEKLQEIALERDIDLCLLGYRNEEEIVELQYCADVFFMPSISDPNPLSCIEALWCNKPLLVSEHVGNYPETIRPGINGYVFSYEKKGDLQEKVKALLEKDEDWYYNAGICSRKIAEEYFEIGKMTAKVLQELRAWEKTNP